ncbi:hypothetical protein VB264_16700 [Arcicella aquatica]|uniref:Uncharacterized protein n=1 Tax=Arcicella aquatica TaxID=217141 RepID=A0ABU5QQT8_9BACT|nr:hypothetical protein [Arcicella aquatica]MEA5259441.1 hypothetical protein [Arcicella aquatica]
MKGNESFEESKVNYRKALAAFKNTGKIDDECFYHDKSTCKGKIKLSHSIQRNGRLSIIEGDINGNKQIYTFTDYEVGETTQVMRLKPIGKGSASTFFGFCDHHDTTLFSPIENNKFDNSDKHCFLHTYRAFAHSYHRKKEEIKAYNTESLFTENIPIADLYSFRNGLELSKNDQLSAKNKLDSLIENEEYNGLEYLSIIVPYSIPIACSSQISPFCTYSGKPFNNHSDAEKLYSIIMITVLPDHDQTIIILSCFPDDDLGMVFLDELDQLYDKEVTLFYRAISAILINYAENTFFAPALWNALGVSGQKNLCKELEYSTSEHIDINCFPKSNINFFNKKFSTNELRIK